MVKEMLEGCCTLSSHVSTELRYGTKFLSRFFATPVLWSASALITSPSVDSDLLIFAPEGVCRNVGEREGRGSE